MEPETYARMQQFTVPGKGRDQRAELARHFARTWAAGYGRLLDALQALPEGFQGSVVFTFTIHEGDAPARLRDAIPALGEGG